MDGPDAAAYRGVPVRRQAGNETGSTPVLIATLGATATPYVDAGLTDPLSGVWRYTVYIRDVVAGPMEPQTTTAAITAAVSGRVTDAHGNGVGGAAVTVGTSPWSTTAAATAADRTWLADGQRDGQYVVCVDASQASGGSSATGCASECFDTVLSPPGTGATGTYRLTVVGDGTAVTGIDLHLR